MDKHSRLKESNSKALSMMIAMSIGTAGPLLTDIESNVITALCISCDQDRVVDY